MQREQRLNLIFDGIARLPLCGKQNTPAKIRFQNYWTSLRVWGKAGLSLFHVNKATLLRWDGRR